MKKIEKEIVTKKEIFVADDGTEFDTQEQCQEYEEQLSALQKEKDKLLGFLASIEQGVSKAMEDLKTNKCSCEDVVNGLLSLLAGDNKQANIEIGSFLDNLISGLTEEPEEQPSESEVALKLPPKVQYFFDTVQENTPTSVDCRYGFDWKIEDFLGTTSGSYSSADPNALMSYFSSLLADSDSLFAELYGNSTFDVKIQFKYHGESDDFKMIDFPHIYRITTKNGKIVEANMPDKYTAIAF